MNDELKTLFENLDDDIEAVASLSAVKMDQDASAAVENALRSVRAILQSIAGYEPGIPCMHNCGNFVLENGKGGEIREVGLRKAKYAICSDCLSSQSPKDNFPRNENKS